MTTSFSSSLAAFAVSLLAVSSAFGQGSLTPPGAPAPTMKTLDQVEARTVVNVTNAPPSTSARGYAYAITPDIYPSGGSFYLTGNIAVTGGGLYIGASNVTLDLNGFSVANTGGATPYTGIFVAGSNVTVFNGGVNGGGFANGVAVRTTNVNALIKNVSVSGAASLGISLANGVVQGCTVNGVGGVGITAPVVSDSSATQCGGTAISAQTISNTLGTTTSSTAQAVVGAQPQADQRIAIPGGTNLGTYTITAPGSYYLAGNYQVASGTAIDITVSDVTLDLNGFTISTASTAAGSSFAGVSSETGVDVAVRNGRILGNGTYDSSGKTFSTGVGFNDAVLITGNGTRNVHLECLATSGTTNGLSVSAGSGTVISRCQASNHAGSGIDVVNSSTTDFCTATNCGNRGISGDMITNCIANVVSSSPLSYAIIGDVILNSSGTADNRGTGVSGAIITDCNGYTQGSTANEFGIESQSGVANTCRTGNPNGGNSTALKAKIAVGCIVEGTSSITYRYNMP